LNLFSTSADQKQDLPMVTMFFSSNRDEMGKCYRGPSIDASCQILLYLAKWFQGKRFLEIDPPVTRISYGGQVSGYKMSNLIENLP